MEPSRRIDENHRVVVKRADAPLTLRLGECRVKMGLAGLRAFTTVDSGMPTVTAARPFRWGWRCLGEQRDDLCSNLRTFFAVEENAWFSQGFEAERR